MRAGIRCGPACEENAVVICCHIGSAGNAPYPSDESPIDAWITSMPISIANAAADWLFASFWKRYPRLRMALSEGGIGWIPYFLERADFTYGQHSAWTHTNFGKEKPSDVFRRHVMTCFIDDEFGLRNRQDIGIDIICWEADYPHSDATWPRSPEQSVAGYSLAAIRRHRQDHAPECDARLQLRSDRRIRPR